MQFKMAGSPRILQRFYRLYFRFFIPALAWAATWWPRPLMYWMARRLVILPFVLVRPKYLRAVRGNCGRILGVPPESRQARGLAMRMMYEHAYHWIDFFRYSQLPPDRLDAAVVAVEGNEHFERVRAAGRGVLLLTAHMGNAEVGAVAMGSRFARLSVLYWRDRFEKAEEFRNRMRMRGNVHGIPVDASPLSVVPALRILREGGLLGAHGDRDFNDQGWPVEFFGAPASFPPGPFLLAGRARALMLPTFFLLEPDRRFRVIFEPPLEVSPEAIEESARAAMARWVAVLERRIRQFPEQWYCFYPFWEGGNRAEGGRAAERTVRGGEVSPSRC